MIKSSLYYEYNNEANKLLKELKNKYNNKKYKAKIDGQIIFYV